MRKRLIALVDCSAFYCSCERVFRPELKNRPVCVLSNNDGCVIALTPEVKALGITMGTPYFQVKDQLKKLGVATFSSNYCLYADMSRRVVELLERFSDEVEQYSIDEAFIAFSGDTEQLDASREKLQRIAEEIHFTVLKGTGIPVRVSIAETKTLAKIGSEYTKKLLKEGKVPAVCFWEHPEKESFMKNLPVEDVWGIGRQWSRKLRGSLINTAWDLSNCDPQRMRTFYNVVMERTVRELKGTSCIPLELEVEPRKSLIRSRMFAKKLNDPRLIQQAVSSHLFRATQKLRREKLVARELTVFITTGRHAEVTKHSRISQRLTRHTNDTFILNDIAIQLFEKIYQSHTSYGEPILYSKAGIILNDLLPNNPVQDVLFEPQEKENPEIMKILDSLNTRFGKNTIVLASMGTPKKLRNVDMGEKNAVEWGMQRQFMSPRYTTVLTEILRVRI